jgi:hypothetical protein
VAVGVVEQKVRTDSEIVARLAKILMELVPELTEAQAVHLAYDTLEDVVATVDRPDLHLSAEKRDV